tara:strand:- start:80 stop:520 length:441 start_codon:yes stop_codon:yes gene_type:complete
MDHHRLRKYRGPETWARVKAAYVAGEPAPSVARRFDVGLSNLRRRAMAEGWTRNRIAETLDLKPVRGGADDPGAGLEPLPVSTSPADAVDPPWIDPDLAVTRAVRRAAWLVSEGRAVEARVLIRAAEALKSLDAWRGIPDGAPRSR